MFCSLTAVTLMPSPYFVNELVHQLQALALDVRPLGADDVEDGPVADEHG
ncbi:MAG: hypothetical protein MZU97_12400 [Bacillus subtilis]|nr:hypothetical protein [Bacillus subtilis]